MSQNLGLGEVNPHVVGIVMKELVRRSINLIRSEQQSFEVQKKLGHSGKMDDVFTSADKGAQEVFLKSLRECFPDAGIIAEEKKLVIEPKNGCKLYFTVDPMDGTKAFIRRQSHGVGSMIALSDGDKVLAAFVGDVNTQEIFGYRPGSDKVHRITMYNISEHLEEVNRPELTAQYVLLRDPLDHHSHMTQNVIKHAFKSHMVDGGSIGTWMARLWKGEVGGVVLDPGDDTPWDSTPIIGISQKLGFHFLEPTQHGWCDTTPRICQETYYRQSEILVIHKDNLEAFFAAKY